MSIQVRAQYPKTQTWEVFDGEKIEDIVNHIIADLADPENFIFSINFDFDPDFPNDNFHAETWAGLQEY